MANRSARRVSLALAVVLSACGSEDSFSPTVAEVAGSYRATIFAVTSASGTTACWPRAPW